jgi:LacI family transcriptional regulator
VKAETPQVTDVSDADSTQRPRATAKDVGALAGVSTASVSRVLSGRRPVTDSVRRRVIAAASELGYVPNHFGRALRRQRSGTIGLLVPQITNPFFPLLIEEFEAAAQDMEFHVLIAVSHYDVGTERQRLRELVALNVDACVIVPADAVSSAEAIIEAHASVPLTQLDGRTSAADVPHIGMDNQHAVSLLFSHLLDRGRRSIAFVTGGLATSPDVERYEAFRELAAQSTGQARFMDVQGLDYSFDTGRRAAAEIAHADPVVDAVICSNDVIALALIEELERLGKRVPQDVAVCGVDDIGFSGLFRPTLTTVRQPMREMSRLAVDELKNRHPAARRDARQSIRIKGELVVRMSSR